VQFGAKRVLEAMTTAGPEIALLSALKDAQAKKRRDPTIGQFVFRMSQAFVWPFLLTIAFALRITKVTIDVGNWTREETKGLIGGEQGVSFYIETAIVLAFAFGIIAFAYRS
jgi:hypothetical protein